VRAPRLAGARLAVVAVVAVAAAPGCAPSGAASQGVAIVLRYSHFAPGTIVGPPEVHAAHRVGTEPSHAERPTEVTVPALATRQTRITWDRPGEYAFICHLPGHEAYGMRGTVRVVAR
jgi:plastocyanin